MRKLNLAVTTSLEGSNILASVSWIGIKDDALLCLLNCSCSFRQQKDRLWPSMAGMIGTDILAPMLPFSTSSQPNTTQESSCGRLTLGPGEAFSSHNIAPLVNHYYAALTLADVSLVSGGLRSESFRAGGKACICSAHVLLYIIVPIMSIGQVTIPIRSFSTNLAPVKAPKCPELTVWQCNSSLEWRRATQS